MSTTRPPMHDDRSTGSTSSAEASRRGAHRARTKALSAGLPVLAGIAVILLVVGGIYVVLGNRGSSPASDDTTVAAEPTPTASLPSSGATTAPSAGTPATSAPADSEPEESTTTTSAASEPAGNAGDIDKSINVVVLNSTGVKGLASRGESALTSKGWNVTRTGNSINKGLSTTKIYYGDADNQATAEAVQTALGYGQVFQDSSVTRTGVTVVLGHDAE